MTTIREQAERGIALWDAMPEEIYPIHRDHFQAEDSWIDQCADFFVHAANTYRPLAEAYLEAAAALSRVWSALGIETYEQAEGKEVSELVTALRQRHEKLRKAAVSVLTEAWDKLDAALAADEGEVEPPDGQG